MKKLFSILLLALVATASAQNTGSPYTRGVRIYVDPLGNDNNSGSAASPKQTISNAVYVATAGDTVNVRAGTYAENNLLKQGVNIVGEVGADIVYVQTTTNDAGYGIFDDRYSGATTNTILWPGRLVFIGITNLLSYYDTNEDSGTFDYNSGTLGCIVQTNPSTVLSIKGGLVSGSIFSFVGSMSTIYALAGEGEYDFDNVTNVCAGQSYGLGLVTISAGGNGLFTSAGNTKLRTRTLYGSTYAWFWASGSPTTTNDVYITADIIKGMCYGDAASSATRGWVKASEIDASDSGGVGVPISCFGGGKWYFDALKVKAKAGQPTIDASASAAGVSNALVWVRAQKLESDTGFVWARSGTFYVAAQEFNFTGSAMQNGITNQTSHRVHVQYVTSGRTNIAAAASSLVVDIPNRMPGTNYTVTASCSFNPVAIMSIGSLTRSNFTVTFSTGVTTGGSIFWSASQNTQ